MADKKLPEETKIIKKSRMRVYRSKTNRNVPELPRKMCRSRASTRIYLESSYDHWQSVKKEIHCESDPEMAEILINSYRYMSHHMFHSNTSATDTVEPPSMSKAHETRITDKHRIKIKADRFRHQKEDIYLITNLLTSTQLLINNMNTQRESLYTVETDGETSFDQISGVDSRILTKSTKIDDFLTILNTFLCYVRKFKESLRFNDHVINTVDSADTTDRIRTELTDQIIDSHDDNSLEIDMDNSVEDVYDLRSYSESNLNVLNDIIASENTDCDDHSVRSNLLPVDNVQSNDFKVLMDKLEKQELKLSIDKSISKTACKRRKKKSNMSILPKKRVSKPQTVTTKLKVQKPRPTHFQCDTCGKQYDKEDSLRYHKWTHNKRYPCSECGHLFPTSYMMKEHRRSHFEQRIYLCTLCGVRFKLKASLNGHMRSRHSDVRNFACSICPKMFKTGSTLKRHCREVHENARPFICDVCEKAFANKTNLRVHTASHVRGTIHVKMPVKCSVPPASVSLL